MFKVWILEFKKYYYLGDFNDELSLGIIVIVYKDEEKIIKLL